MAETLATRPIVRAIIPVHLFGGCADMDPILELAAARGIPVIEDAAQSIGSEYKGRRAGSIGQIGCFSFFPSKNLGGYGDGGLVTTNDAALAERLTALAHAWQQEEILPRVDWLQFTPGCASGGRVAGKFRYLDGWSEGRQRNADLYRVELAKRSVPVTAAAPPAYQTRHIYNQFVIRAERRDALQAHLKDQGIGSEVVLSAPAAPAAVLCVPGPSRRGFSREREPGRRLAGPADLSGAERRRHRIRVRGDQAVSTPRCTSARSWVRGRSS